ncbi:MAG TPA: 8-oxoguanine deaminase [Anaerolineae bacterium]|nr:8-oxoguanine deaminase [Anaerolineae bacterium]
MSTLLVKNADIVITLDDQGRKLRGGGLFVRDNVIEQVGPSEALPAEADEVIDATGLAVLPGLVNTHHHFFQSLFRAVPGAQDHGLFDWLVRLFPIYGEVTAEAIYLSSLTAMAELILSGCTTSSDHLYLYPNDTSLEAQIRAAGEIGLRFHAMRGAMSLGRSRGGLSPDHLVQDEEHILTDCQRLIETYHDPAPFSMLRVGLAPCTPFTVTKTLMRETARLARAYPQVRLHTHVAETMDEEVYCLREFNQRPADYMVEVGWVGPEVWWAHSIFLNRDEIRLLAETGTGVAHCPSSNMRLGSGICPVREMLDAGVKVSIGVDGSASNDTGHLLNEARTAVLLQRVKHGAGAFSIEEGLDLAIRGGAAVLGRAEIGTLAVGRAADFIGVNLKTLAMAGGAVHDPLAALLLCRVDRVDLSVINGRVVVRHGQLLTIDLEPLITRHNELAAEFVSRHPVPERFKLV